MDDHFLIACRYVERNALRAGLVTFGAVFRERNGPILASLAPGSSPNRELVRGTNHRQRVPFLMSGVGPAM